MIDKAEKDHELIMAILAVLSGKEWEAHTLDDIADLLTSYGYKIDEPRTDGDVLQP